MKLGSLEGLVNQLLSCVGASFLARANLSDFDSYRLQSSVQPFEAVDITAGLDGSSHVLSYAN